MSLSLALSLLGHRFDKRGVDASSISSAVKKAVPATAENQPGYMRKKIDKVTNDAENAFMNNVVLGGPGQYLKELVTPSAIKKAVSFTAGKLPTLAKGGAVPLTMALNTIQDGYSSLEKPFGGLTERARKSVEKLNTPDVEGGNPGIVAGLDSAVGAAAPIFKPFRSAVAGYSDPVAFTKSRAVDGMNMVDSWAGKFNESWAPFKNTREWVSNRIGEGKASEYLNNAMWSGTPWPVKATSRYIQGDSPWNIVKNSAPGSSYIQGPILAENSTTNTYKNMEDMNSGQRNNYWYSRNTQAR